MDITNVTPDEIEAIRAAAPWIKVFGSGIFISLIITLWKMFNLYKRLLDVETGVKTINSAGYMTVHHHDLLTANCQGTIKAEIDKQTTALHIKWLEEMNDLRSEIAAVREIQCNVLGKLDEISKSVDSLKHSINNGRQK